MTSPLSLKPLEIEDRKTFLEHFPSRGLLSCEYSFVNLFLWGDSYPVEWGLWQGKLLLRSLPQDYLFLPEHRNCSVEELKELSQTARSEGWSGAIFFLDETYAKLQQPALEKHFTLEYSREYADYIYRAEHLAHLKGAGLAKRRNQINQFYKKNRHVRCIPLHPELYSEYTPLLERWSRGKKTYEAAQIEQEKKAICRAFRYYKELELQGLVLYADNYVVGISLFSRCNEDFGLVHFEKADIRYTGAYQVINKETAKILEQQCPYINREQDLGIPGLRHAKESYLPDHLLGTCFLYPKE